MSNTISRRIFDYLKNYPPFSMLTHDVLQRVSERVLVQYRQPGEVIFRAGETPKKLIYVVREGAVHLIRREEEEDVVVEQCDEGDAFGIRPLLAADNYALTAVAAEETLLYAVNIEGFEQVLQDNPRISFYLASNMAAGIRRKLDPAVRGHLLVGREMEAVEPFQLMELQSIERAKKPVTCLPDVTVKEAARIMSARSVGSIIVVDEAGLPLGIVTDKDFRRKVVTGKYTLDTPVSKIMSSPVRTVAPEIAVAEVQIEMIKHHIHHLCVTEDGTADTPVVGVISEHDLLVLQGNNPAVIIREIMRALGAAELRQLRERAEVLLRKYLLQEVGIAYITTVMTAINDAIIERCIELSLIELEFKGGETPTVPFCWLALGSEGRGEQLLRTDQDNALVFADVPEEEYAATKEYFLSLATKVTERLNAVGFAYCPGDMMASNPRWCMSLERWKNQFSEWMLTPTAEAVLYSTIFFDYRPVYGETELADALTEHIFGILDHQSIFLSFLAKDALKNPPPLTFFRNFVVESSGEHKDEFDIKKRAMMPLADAARVLILHAQVGKINNTFRRYEKLAELEPVNADVYQEAADAYEILIRLRALQGLRQGDSGRYFNPAELSKMERIHLRNCFRPIKEMQTLLSVRFQLAYLR